MTRAATPMAGNALLLAAVALVGLNLRPFITGIGPLAAAIGAETHLTLQGMALLTLVPMLLMGIFAFAGPALQAKVGARRAIMAALGVLSLASILRLFVTTGWQMVGTAALLVSLGIIDTYQAWLSQPATALPALIVAEVWNHVPFVTVVILAALQTIPAELYDASKIDGANVFQRFWSVTFPWLSHSLLLVLITQTMVALRTFDIVYVLTGGGPGDSTTVIAWLTYVTTFSFTDFGKGNAYAYIIALVTLVLSIFYIRMLWKRGEMAR